MAEWIWDFVAWWFVGWKWMLAMALLILVMSVGEVTHGE